MAGDWIPMRVDLWDCPQVVRIMSAFCPQNVHAPPDKCRIIGALYRTWQIVDQYADDGLLPGYTPEALDQAVGIEGWTTLLEQVGWLTIEPQGLGIPEFEQWFGASSKRRLKDAQRKRAARNVRNLSAKDGKTSANCPENVHMKADKMRTRGEKR